MSNAPDYWSRLSHVLNAMGVWCTISHFNVSGAFFSRPRFSVSNDAALFQAHWKSRKANLKTRRSGTSQTIRDLLPEGMNFGFIVLNPVKASITIPPNARFPSMMRVPFPHPASWFSPSGSRPLVSAHEVLPSLSLVAMSHASLTQTDSSQKKSSD